MIKNLTILIMLFVFVLPQNVLALSEEQRRVIDSGARYFNVEDSESPRCVGSLPGNNNAERVWNFLVSKDLSPEQAAGVMGNLQAESGFDPFNQENGQPWGIGGWGLAQWTAGRRDTLRDTVIAELGEQYYVPTEEAGNFIGGNEEVELITFQMEYLYDESIARTVRPQSHPFISQPPAGSNEWEGLKTMQSVEDATYYWEWNFERPAAPHAEVRLDFARQILLDFGVGGATASGSSGCNASLNGVICPPVMKPHSSIPGYFEFPEAPNGEYTRYSSPTQYYGSQQLVCVVYSVALAFYQHTGGATTLDVGEFNGDGHKSHKTGVDVDLRAQGEYTAGAWTVQGRVVDNYSPELTVVLGKLFIDSGQVRTIYWCPPGTGCGSGGYPNDSSLEELQTYARETGIEGSVQQLENHHHHMHVRIKLEHQLSEYVPAD